jgi:hypothetical protein
VDGHDPQDDEPPGVHAEVLEQVEQARDSVFRAYVAARNRAMELGDLPDDDLPDDEAPGGASAPPRG